MYTDILNFVKKFGQVIKTIKYHIPKKVTVLPYF